MLTDPELNAYKAAELKSGVIQTFSPRGLLPALRALRSGHRQQRTQGSNLQQGGAFVIRPDGSVPYIKISAFTGDHANTAEILGALGKT